MMRLAKESDKRGWWLAERESVPGWFEKYIGLESEASLIESYEAEHMPGLLQTSGYVRAISIATRPEISEEDLARSVRLRQARQQRLDEEDPPHLFLVVNEAVIRRIVGSSEVMREQIQHLIDMAQRPNITLQVLPFTAGAHPAMNGSFIMLSFPDNAGHTVYLEIEGGALYPDKPRHLTRYKVIFQQLRDQALSPKATASLLSRVMEEL